MPPKSKPSLSKTARAIGLDLGRARKKWRKRREKEDRLLKMGNAELVELIQDLRNRVIVRDVLAEPVTEFRRGRLREARILLAEEQRSAKKESARKSPQHEHKGPPLMLSLIPRTRSKRK